ncbi:TPA: hypothetical protein N0F65_006498 [Lagenidium giganteum]|uniref:PX domain-containing protein n=1 Tax=Lagenidium giganteum TaxID=4803 RepID=A0AAV2YP64_9STRA|nr:TPA: hypothetical protein N0F65_006498 [Lagenidium giganteum]
MSPTTQEQSARKSNHPLKKRMSSIGQVTRRDITALLRVDVSVDGFQFDSSIMEHPEFLITTSVLFQCRQYGGTLLQSKWQIYRTFQEFQGLDNQLRRSYPGGMSFIKPPRAHHRRTFFRMHRGKKFLATRCQELSAYLTALLQDTTMRLTHLMDPRAPPFLRGFVDFDNGFGTQTQVQRNQVHDCGLCLDSVIDPQPEDQDPELDLVVADPTMQSQRDILKQQQQQRHQWRLGRKPRGGSKSEDLVTNLLDDRSRNMVMCSRYGCICQNSSFRTTDKAMKAMLLAKGYRVVLQPREGITALTCVLFYLQQINDIDERLYEMFAVSPQTATTEEADEEQDQLSTGVDTMREALSNYGLLHVHLLQEKFRMSVVDLKRKMHAFKNRLHYRVGAMELVILCTMLDLSITLVTNDHHGTVQDIFPLSDIKPIRSGGRLLITLGYVLPTEFCVDGSYLLIEKMAASGSRVASVDRRMWLGLEELNHLLVAQIDEHMESDLSYLSEFDYDLADSLNKAILDAVWSDCQHNPSLFHLFEKQARQFGKSRVSAEFFVLYLEVAFGIDGAMYLLDFLLHVLPEEELRKKLLRARWIRFKRHMLKRLQGYCC